MILILGAGLTGLAAAYFLKGRDYLVIEKENEPGGLCRTTECNGFYFDFTGHFLHLRDETIRELVFDLLPDGWLEAKRASFIHYRGVYTPYPFQAHTYGLPLDVVRECLIGFIEAREEKSAAAGKYKNFKEWVEARFGKGFARHFFLPYNYKLWHTPLEDITTEWVDWAVPTPTAAEVVDGALGTGQAHLGYNASFYYPLQGGIGTFTSALAGRVAHLETGKEVVAVDHRNKTAHCKNGDALRYDVLVSPLPLKKLLEITRGIPEGLKQDGEKLRYASVFNLNLGLDRKDDTGRHWIYFPEKAFPFYRIGYPSNISEAVAPPGTTSLYIEVSHLPETPLDEETTVEGCIEQMKQLQIIRPEDKVIAKEVKHIPYAYVIHDRRRLRCLAPILTALKEAGIYSIGRYGSWEYSFMEKSLLAGKNLAETLAP